MNSVSFRVKLFGNIQILVGDREVHPPRSRKGMWLLAQLILRQGAPIEREALASLMWPDSDRPQAMANLRTCLSEMRGALGTDGFRLNTPSRQTVRFDLKGADVDVVEFDRCISSGRRTDLERATTLYIGPLLAGCNEEWAVQERTGREQACLRAFQTLGEVAYRSGDHQVAANWFQRAAAMDPWSDAAHRGWMLALSAQGDTNQAIQTYRAFEQRLRAEAAMSPDDKTTALYSKLRFQARGREEPPAADTPAKGNVPHPLTDLIGREDDLIELGIQLRHSRLITLTGLGGIGKTRLAIAVAQKVAPEFLHGCWFVPLDSLSDREMVPRQICSALGLEQIVGRSWIEILTEHLKSKRAFIVLDNCEHLSDACARVCLDLLQDCFGVRILTTSREVLGVPGELVWTVPTLPVPDPDRLPKGSATRQRVIAGYEGVQLFLERARFANRNFALSGENVEGVAKICFALEGLPLAIELAAAHVSALSVHQIAAGLGDQLDLLRGSKRGLATRHLTLRFCLDWSYQLLSQEEKALLRRFSVFVGGGTLDAVENVCSSEGSDRRSADLLEELVTKSLILFVEDAGDGNGRYRMVETVRQYGQEKLREAGEEGALEVRHRDWTYELTEKARAEMKGGQQAFWLNTLSVEHANRLKGLQSFQNDSSTLIQSLWMAAFMSRFWLIRGPSSEGRAVLRRALEHPGLQADTAARGAALSALGTLAFHDGDVQVAKGKFEESLAILQRLGDRPGMVSPALNLATVFSAEGNPRALEAMREALVVAKEVSDHEAHAVCHVNVGLILLGHGKPGESRESYQEAQKIYEWLGQPRGMSLSLEGIGDAFTALGEYGEAWIHHEGALKIRMEIQDQEAPWSLHKLGVVSFCRGDLDDAQARFQYGMSVFEEGNNNRVGVAAAKRYFGYISTARGDFGAARTHLEGALELDRELKYHKRVPDDLAGLADLTNDLGSLDEARRFASEALSLAQKTGALATICTCVDSYAGVCVSAGNPGMAVRLWAANDSARRPNGVKRPLPFEVRFNRSMSRARVALGDASFEAYWSQGASLDLAVAVAQTLTELGKL